MSSYANTDECRQLTFQIDSYLGRPGGRDYYATEIAVLRQRRADGYWHYANPGLTGSWRLANVQGSLIGEGSMDNRIPRFETREAAEAWIEGNGHAGSLRAVHRASRQTLEALTARYSEAA